MTRPRIHAMAASASTDAPAAVMPVPRRRWAAARRDQRAISSACSRAASALAAPAVATADAGDAISTATESGLRPLEERLRAAQGLGGAGGGSERRLHPVGDAVQHVVDGFAAQD